MKLAILVAYRLTQALEPLLELHLSQIARLTRVPYTLHALDCGLPPTLRRRLDQQPHARVATAPPTALTGSDEHAFYLEALTRQALATDASHLVTMHPDSFPVADGWAETLAARLSPTRPLATLGRFNTACLLFTREFWDDCAPRYRIAADERATAVFEAFMREHDPCDHSGTGYGLAAYRHGLGWHALERDPCPALDDTPAGSYEGLIFHLGKTVRATEPEAVSGRRAARPLPASGRHLLQAVRTACPPAARRCLRRCFPEWLDRWHDEPRRAELRSRYERAWDYVFSDVEGFLERVAEPAGARVCGRGDVDAPKGQRYTR